VTLSAAEATALGAICATGGALLGVMIRGAIDVRLHRVQLTEQGRTAREQLEQQRKLAEEQLRQQHETLLAELDHQRQLAERGHAEERARQLLEDRRRLYAEFMEVASVAADKVRTARWRQDALEEKYADVDWETMAKTESRLIKSLLSGPFGEWVEMPTPAWEARDAAIEARSEAERAITSAGGSLPIFQLIAPNSIWNTVKSLYFLSMPDSDEILCGDKIREIEDRVHTLRREFLILARKDLGGDVTIRSG
jgi:multidrug efflux pump subunit AcrA (membrane-fusion protein)